MLMDSPLSPIISDVVLQDLETKAISRLPVNIPFYYRYVDDIVMAIPMCFFQTIFKIFNAFHSRLKFTMEVDVDKKLNFLDVTIINKENRLIFDWFHKPIFFGRYLNFYSHRPVCQKKGTIIGLTDRALLLSHPFSPKKYKHDHRDFNK